MQTPKRPSIRRTTTQTTPGHRHRGWCHSCEKKTYLERRDARDERKRLRHLEPAGAPPLSIYRCPADDTYWHIGHDYERAEHQRLYYLGHGVSMND